ncbi:hypothetical protein LTR53_017129, partial [Teratosphaeriaceae sp. CCFEE 6253]
MAALPIPPGGITLHSAGHGKEDRNRGAATAVLLRLDAGTLHSITHASHAHERLQFVTGRAPELRIGGRAIALTLTADAFRHELYRSTHPAASSSPLATELRYAGLLTHRAAAMGQQQQKKDREPVAGGESTGTDEALAALKHSLASFEQEKQANQTNIQKTLLAVPRNRFEAAKRHKRLGSAGAPPPSSFSPASTPLRDAAAGPTSAAPLSEGEVKLQAMRTPLLHFLAMRPASLPAIQAATQIPRADLDALLQKLARKVEGGGGGEWQLSDRGYKDLDVWGFVYGSQEDRQAAVENAVRAYDRLRIGKEEKIWQGLLPREERGKGVVLSRLHTGNNRGLTPSSLASPSLHSLHAGEFADDSSQPSNANTPRLGASTPRPNSSKGVGGAMKRILAALDPKKARAVEAERAQKRKNRETAAAAAASSDRETARKRSAKSEAAGRGKGEGKGEGKVKSAELVHSSDDESEAGEEEEEEGEVRDDAADVDEDEDEEMKRVDSRLAGPAKPARRAQTTRPHLKAQGSPDNGGGGSDGRASRGPGGAKRAAADPAKSIAALASLAARKPPAAATTGKVTGKVTPRAANGLGAPASQQGKSAVQRSPQKAGSRAHVPSPLGAGVGVGVGVG